MHNVTFMFFFFKQKTAYEMRISDWSSDVCSSDLRQVLLQIIAEHEQDGQPMLSTQLLSQIIRLYGDSLQGFMGTYLDRSMQTFMEQQGQFLQQMGSMLGQTPWTMMNQLTERNMEMWKDFQENLVTGMGRNPSAPATGKDKDAAKGGK